MKLNNGKLIIDDTTGKISGDDARIECRCVILPEYVQSQIDFFPILAVESGVFPNGIQVTKCGIKTDVSSTYSVVFEDWSDPATHNADIATVATSASKEAESADLTTTVAVGEIIGIDLPTTTGVTTLMVWFTYKVL